MFIDLSGGTINQRLPVLPTYQHRDLTNNFRSPPRNILLLSCVLAVNINNWGIFRLGSPPHVLENILCGCIATLTQNNRDTVAFNNIKFEQKSRINMKINPTLVTNFRGKLFTLTEFVHISGVIDLSTLQ